MLSAFLYWLRWHRPVRLYVQLVLWRLGLRRLSLWLHDENEPIFYFQVPRDEL